MIKAGYQFRHLAVYLHGYIFKQLTERRSELIPLLFWSRLITSDGFLADCSCSIDATHIKWC